MGLNSEISIALKTGFVDPTEDDTNNNNSNKKKKKKNKKKKKSNNRRKETNYLPVDILDGTHKGAFFHYFDFETDLFDDDIWNFHLCHNHGGPLRDLLMHFGWACHDSLGYCGMFDERREEGSLAFQMWRTFRMLFRKKAPLDEPTRQQMHRDIMKAIAKSKNWKNSTYIEDTQFHMPDILVDYSMVSLSARLYPAISFNKNRINILLGGVETSIKKDKFLISPV